MRLSHNKSQYSHTTKNVKFASETSFAVMQNSPMTENYARTRIANWLKEALKETGISQAELSLEVQKRHVNLDQTKISRITNLERGMSAEELLACADVLRVPLPTIGTAQPQYLASDDAPSEQEGFQQDLSELALQITRELEKTEYSGDMPDDTYIEASALLYNMLRSTGAWYPHLFEASKKMMSKVKKERDLSDLSFTDYVKSVAIYYRTLTSAEENAT